MKSLMEQLHENPLQIALVENEELRTQLAKANERVVILEQERDHAQRMYNSLLGDLSVGYGALSIPECESQLNKFAIERKIEALDDLLEEIQCSVVVPKRYEQLQEPYLEGIKHCIQFIECQSEQLRKEQSQC